MDFSDVIIWQLRQKIWSSAKDLFGIAFLDGAKLSNERNGCWRKKTNWPGNGFSENEKRALLDFFFGFYATNGVKDKTYFRFASIKLQN